LGQWPVWNVILVTENLGLIVGISRNSFFQEGQEAEIVRGVQGIMRRWRRERVSKFRCVLGVVHDVEERHGVAMRPPSKPPFLSGQNFQIWAFLSIMTGMTPD
jgi:hypothetical protein